MTWSLVYDRYLPEREGTHEALCTLGNGYFCVRGAAPDCADDGTHYPGTYVGGLYNRRTSTVAGREIENEDLVNLPNWLVLTARIDGGPWFRLDDMEILDYRQELEMKTGVLHRRIRLRDGEGRVTAWRERRIVSMADKHLAAIALELEAENWSGRLEIHSAIDGRVINNNVARYRSLEQRHLVPQGTGTIGDDVIFLRTRTSQSRVDAVQAVRTRLYRNGDPLAPARETTAREDWINQDLALDLAEGATVTVEKVMALYTSTSFAISEPALAATEAVAAARRFDSLLADHAAAWAELWGDFDMTLAMRPLGGAEMKLRLHVFHLLQTVSENSIDADIGVPARGWHGEAYRGHIFWDELFILPFLNFRRPLITRSLLKYRYRRLGAARRLAEAEGFRGALYPWQSGSDGREETQVVHLNPKSGEWIPDNSHRQRHVNAAIAHNIWRYFEVTGDGEFMRNFGAEMYLEIAKFWASIVEERPDGRYGIREVMGPDEFTTGYPGVPPEEERGIDNNAYTNVMASLILHQAEDVADILTPRCRRALFTRIGITEDDIERWDAISRRIFVPFHDDGIISQFEGFEKLEEFDWQGYRERHGDIHRLDRILGAEGRNPNDFKVSKQADVLMLFFLFTREELEQIFERLGYGFDPSWIPKNIDYYIARTSHGSTLSHVVHSWVLARSDRPMAWDLLQNALDADVGDIQGGTTREGIHLGAMASTVDLFQRCLIGLEVRGGILHVNPVLPEGVDALTVRVRCRSHSLSLALTRDAMDITSEPGAAPPLTVGYRGHFRELGAGGKVHIRLVKPNSAAAGPATARAVS